MDSSPFIIPDIMVQLRRILPAEGWLTERMARLREKMEFTRQGDIGRVLEAEKGMATLPPAARKKAAAQLVAEYNKLNLDGRLVRLDKAVA